jgi:lipid II:glycine glycyltransferase (peptidoglycan interpeptide bridge formation enzyme)
LVMNLRETDEQLNGNLSQSHRKKIRKSKKGAQVVEIFDHLSTPEVINKEFSDYQALHLKAAGKMTRPQESFDFMRDLIKAGKAVLFTNKLDNKPLSSLYCDYYNNIARGWSQANDKDYEKEYSPRHLTEWEAILYFKSKGIDYYELGSQFTNGQISTLCNNKLLGIATFKERFGSNIYPEIHFEKYLDKNLFISTFNQRINDFCELNFKP